MTVIDLKKMVKVPNWDFVNRDAKPITTHNNTVAAICDGTVIKFILFSELADQVEIRKCYVIKNYGLSKFGSQKSMLSKKNTAI